MKTCEHAKNPRGRFAGFSSRKINDISQNPRTCEQNQHASLSEKDRRLLALFEEDVGVRFADRTAEHYIADARFFVSWLAEHGIALVEVRPPDVQRYQSELYAMRKKDGKPYAAASIQLRLITVRILFRFLFRRGFLLFDPSAGIELPRIEKHLPRLILSEDEARRIVTAPRGRAPLTLRDRAMLEVLYGTGVRVGELVNLKPADVDVEEGTLRVIMGKGKKDRHVPLTRQASRAVETYLLLGRPALVADVRPAPSWLFVGRRGRKLDRAIVGKAVKHWTQKAGVKKHVSCHTFRHSVATHLLRHRADIRQIQALLGHSDLSTTERYTHVEIQDLRRVIERAHPRGR
jgi:integrase/recombinase XerD